MAYKQGEALWYGKVPESYRDIEHRKPFVQHGGSILAEAGAILSLLPEAPCHVLDLGCAGGHLSHILSLSGYDVTGIDICEEVIERANDYNVSWNSEKSTAEFITTDFDKLPFHYCDAIVFASALHHSTNRLETLYSCFNALKPGGMLIASEPGLGHTMGKDCAEWEAQMDVTEKSTPPYLIIRDAKTVGFHKFKVYPNPTTLHKTAYCNRELKNHPIVQKLMALPFAILGCSLSKYFHGLTVMYKPTTH